MTSICLSFSGNSQVKDNDDVLLDVVLMFNGGKLGTRESYRGLCLNFVPMKNVITRLQLIGLQELLKKNIQCTNELPNISDDWYCVGKENCCVSYV